MQKKRLKPETGSAPTAARSLALSRSAARILRYANRRVATTDFLRGVSKLLLESCRCDAVELWLTDHGVRYRSEATGQGRFVILHDGGSGEGRQAARGAAASLDRAAIEKLWRDVARGRLDCSLPCFTRNGSFWTADTTQPLRFAPEQRGSPREGLRIGGRYRSLALIRLGDDDKAGGLLQVKSLRPNCFSREDVEAYEGLAQTLGLAITSRRLHWALRERVKELTCLYGIARVAQRPGLTVAETLQAIVELLPPAWQYPEIACARLTVDGHDYVTGCPSLRPAKGGTPPHRQTADILVGGTRRGLVEVLYLRDKPQFAEGPFLKEERSLIDTVAREVALIIERREADDYRTKLQDQLRHADRLATIGQLAAGIAHELNEPLGSILGFAQLALKNPKLPGQAAKDLERIVATSLHAREIIRKLLIFARQKPPLMSQVDLNHAVSDSLHFLGSRCAAAGVEVALSLAPDLPLINADGSQLQQVLVNLVVNAVQAMPNGGKLSIGTRPGHGYVSLLVDDTGTGMTEEVRKKLFIPFFTTKDVSQGTGLGLAVVHGIVTAHGGSIHVESEPGRGARFEIQLPLDAGAGAAEQRNGGAR
jgi:signal transduction histidine kinase